MFMGGFFSFRPFHVRFIFVPGLPLPQGKTTRLLPIYYPFHREKGSKWVAQVRPRNEAGVVQVYVNASHYYPCCFCNSL